jgi:AcrR family transcriptional regulator
MQPATLDEHPTSAQTDDAPPDGRRARWTEHRRARREDLVTAAVEAVRLAGPEFAVEDVARSAGVSKTVIYRYFSDKDELVDAVLGRISEAILLPRLLGELAAERRDDRAQLRAVIAAFVSLIEDEPALYRFAYAHAGRSGRADLVAATEREIAEALGVLMGERLQAAGRARRRTGRAPARPR